MINEIEYNLKDQLLYSETSEMGLMVWIPESKYIVIGNSNKAINTVDSDAVVLDNIPVLKRHSGGEAVILTPNMICISIVKKEDQLGTSKKIFHEYNDCIISTLADYGIVSEYRGISDIAIGKKKILGSAMFKKQRVLFYHAVLNVSEDVSLIAKYLKHPEREPDYRQGRSHDEFVTSLKSEGHALDIQELRKKIEQSIIKKYSNTELALYY